MAETVTRFGGDIGVYINTLRTTARGRANGEAEFRATFSLGNGTGNNQVNKHWEDRRTLAASANDDLDMAGGLTDQYGNAITFTAVKFIAIVNISVLIATKIIVGNTSTTLFTVPFQATISKNAPFLWGDFASGEAVVAGTGDLLRITNADAVNAALYDIFIAGVTA